MPDIFGRKSFSNVRKSWLGLQAVSGRGVDRLFFGMKRIASEAGIQIPDFFLDKGMVVSTHFKLSTSQVGFRNDLNDSCRTNLNSRHDITRVIQLSLTPHAGCGEV